MHGHTTYLHMYTEVLDSLRETQALKIELSGRLELHQKQKNRKEKKKKYAIRRENTFILNQKHHVSAYNQRYTAESVQMKDFPHLHVNTEHIEGINNVDNTL